MPRVEGSEPRLTAIFARALDWTIGHQGRIPWFAPHDLRFFKERTKDNMVIMGRATWESLPKKPLPGRLNMVLSSKRPTLGILWARNINQVIDVCKDEAVRDKEGFVIGGVHTFESLWPWIDRAIVTKIDAHVDGDTKFDPSLLEDFEIRVPGGVIQTPDRPETVWVYERTIPCES